MSQAFAHAIPAAWKALSAPLHPINSYSGLSAQYEDHFLREAFPGIPNYSFNCVTGSLQGSP